MIRDDELRCSVYVDRCLAPCGGSAADEKERSMSLGLRRAAVWFGWVILQAAAARAQCGGEYLAGSGLPGLSGQATATTVWAPSGPGSEVVVVAGQFTA